MCKSWCELILGLIILVSTYVDGAYSKWVTMIAAIILVLHSFTCKGCFGGHSMEMPAKKKK